MKKLSWVVFVPIFVIAIILVLLFSGSQIEAEQSSSSAVESSKSISDLSDIADDYDEWKFEYIRILPNSSSFQMDQHYVYAVDLKKLSKAEEDAVLATEVSYYMGDVPVRTFYVKEGSDELIDLYRFDGTVIATFTNPVGYDPFSLADEMKDFYESIHGTLHAGFLDWVYGMYSPTRLVLRVDVIDAKEKSEFEEAAFAASMDALDAMSAPIIMMMMGSYGGGLTISSTVKDDTGNVTITIDGLYDTATYAVLFHDGALDHTSYMYPSPGEYISWDLAETTTFDSDPDTWIDDGSFTVTDPSDTSVTARFYMVLEVADTDTDGDGLEDDLECFMTRTDTESTDTDGDSISDYDEYFTYETDPNDTDSDDDGLDDYEEEITYGTDANDTDTDGDGLNDGDEVRIGTDADSADTIMFVDYDDNPDTENGSLTYPFASIQTAIDTCPNDGFVYVFDGIYPEAIKMANGIDLFGAGIDLAIIDADGFDSPTVHFDNDTATLLGFTIVNGSGYTSGANEYGGGIYVDSSVATIEACDISFNSVTYFGGGIYLAADSSGTVADCNIHDNQVTGATSYGGGAGAYFVDDVKFLRCVFENNSAGSSGGGLFVVGDNDSLGIINCLFVHNEASSLGGGIGMSADGVSVVNSTLVDNSADTGGGIFASPSGPPTMTNCIVWNNSDDQTSGCTATYSCVEDGGTADNNIEDTPVFYDPDRGDYHLHADSPCTDTGTNTGAPDDDFEGEARPFNTTTDMGYDEFVDSDSDGLPDYWESQYGLDPNDATGDNGATGDPDDDGNDNETEYDNRTNPMVDSAPPTVTIVQPEENTKVVGY
jgi:predicted outer membrane repeat protein